MAPKQKPWFRAYTEITTDHKLRRLPVAQRWLWVAVLVLARKSPEPGRLLIAKGVPVTALDLADEAAVEIEDVEAGLANFQAKEMLHRDGDAWVVTHWDARQFQTDDVSDRVAAHRERTKDKAGDVTPMKRYIVPNVTPDVTLDVTPMERFTSETEPREQIQKTETEEGTTRASAAPAAPIAPASTTIVAVPKPGPSRADQEMFTAFTVALGYGPDGPNERGKWNKGIQVLRGVEPAVTPDEVPRLVAAYIEEFDGGVGCSPWAVSNHIGRLRHRANNPKAPPQSRGSPNGKPTLYDRNRANFEAVFGQKETRT